MLLQRNVLFTHSFNLSTTPIVSLTCTYINITAKLSANIDTLSKLAQPYFLTQKSLFNFRMMHSLRHATLLIACQPLCSKTIHPFTLFFIVNLIIVFYALFVAHVGQTYIHTIKINSNHGLYHVCFQGIVLFTKGTNVFTYHLIELYFTVRGF